MRQKNKPQDQQRPTLSGWDQVRASDVRIGLLSEADVPTATARTATPQQMRWKASGEKEGRRRETKWRPSLRETLRKDRATGLRGWPKPPCDNAPDPNQAALSPFAASEPAVNPGKRNYLVSWCPKLDFCLQTKMQFARVRPMPAIPCEKCTCERDRRSSRASVSRSARRGARCRRSQTRRRNAGRPRGRASRIVYLERFRHPRRLTPVTGRHLSTNGLISLFLCSRPQASI